VDALPSFETIRIENGGRLEAGLDDMTAVLRRAQNLVECTKIADTITLPLRS
jgi:hypothetical protein